MVKIGLELKADLELVTNLRPDGEDFRWYIKVKCFNCGECTTEYQYLSLAESSPLKGGRGSASLVMKCKLCGRENSIDIIADSIKPYDIDHSGKFKTIVVFDCRGMEPVDFSPRIGFMAEGAETNTKFPEIDLTEGDWADYDEKQKEAVGVYNIEHRFKKV